MAHYAYINENNVVTQVIVGRDENDLNVNWEEYYGAIRCSYNTRGGVHIYGGIPFRKNYPGPGYFYDNERDAFIPPKPFESWILNEDSCLWEAPIPIPEEGQWDWDEDTTSWNEIGFDSNKI